MRFISFYRNNAEETGILKGNNVIPLQSLHTEYNWDFPIHLDEIFSSNQFFRLKSCIKEKSSDITRSLSLETIPLTNIKTAPLYRHPSKIWGIGLNYREHASDLEESAPSTIPASFMKADTTIIGQGDTIQLPSMVEKTTGEAELGVIFGKKCKNVSQNQWKDVIAGFTCIIDMTAESILRKNPRYLTISKNFDTFFSFGPVLITPEEITDITLLKVSTIHNGEVYAENIIKHMTFPPDFLISFHSNIMTFLPGDIISTGTPRAAELHTGDTIACSINGFPQLFNPVE